MSRVAGGHFRRKREAPLILRGSTSQFRGHPQGAIPGPTFTRTLEPFDAVRAAQLRSAAPDSAKRPKGDICMDPLGETSWSVTRLGDQALVSQSTSTMTTTAADTHHITTVALVPSHVSSCR